MALIKPEQLQSGSYSISGSFSGSFYGDGNGLTNLPTQSINTSSFVTTSSFNAFTSSINSFTSSYNTGSFTGSFRGDGSQLTGTSKWTGSNPISRESDVEISGSLTVTGSGVNLETDSFIVHNSLVNVDLLTVNDKGVTIHDTSDIQSIDAESRQLYDLNGNLSIDWSARRLLNSSNITIVDWEAGTFSGTADTASFVTASNVVGTVTSASYAESASYLIGGTGSFVTTASFNAFTASYTTGSFTGSFTGTLNGTASWAENAVTASFVTASNVVGTVTSASYALSASYLIGGVTIDTGSFVSTSSFNTFTSSIQGQVNSLTAATSSYVLTSVTASMLAPYVLTSSTSSMTVLSSSFANTASFVTASNVIGIVSSASLAQTASFVTASNIYGPYGSNSVISSSYALSSSNAVSASFASTASFITASGVIGTVTSASYAVSSSFSTTASYATFAETASSATNAQDILVYVQNNSGYNIAKGVVVHITASGNSSDVPRIVSASYENDANSANTLGITYQAIANGSQGYVMTEGVLRDINTTNFTSGQLIYLGATGSIIGSAPQAPLHAVRLGQVVREQENNGSIYISINNGYELDELHDVRITTASLSYGDLLMRSSSVWINSKQLSGSYALTGSLTATSFTGSLFGTASWSENAITASFITASNVVGTVASASFSLTASYLEGGVTIDTGSLVTTSSFNSFTSSIQGQVDLLTAATSSYMLTSATASMLAPYVLTSQTASMTVLSASFTNTASFVTASNVVGTVTSASYAVTASYAMNGGGGGVTYIRRSDYTSSLDPNVNYLYLGDAVTGSLESSPVWDISRLSISSSGATLTQTTSSAAWTDRYTVTYL